MKSREEYLKRWPPSGFRGAVMIPCGARQQVIHHIFFCLGSGYEWAEDGRLMGMLLEAKWTVLRDDEIEDHIDWSIETYGLLFASENYHYLYPWKSWGLVRYDKGIPDNASPKCLELIAEHCGVILASTAKAEWVAATNKVLRRVRQLRYKV